MRALSRILTVISTVSLGVTLGACSDVPNAPPSTVKRDTHSLQLADARVIASVTGTIQTRIEARSVVTTIHAFRRADGSVEGWARHESLGPSRARLRVRIDCLRIVGHEAWATGTVTYAAGEQNIGRPYSYRFIDNGEGAGDPPDEFAVRRFELHDCLMEPDLETRAVEFGNIQVRPGE